MCGIAGVAGPTDPGADLLVRRMCEAMRHRGPDDLQVETTRDGVLGIARLAVIDPADGRQPLCAGGWVRVVGNGEVFDHVELRAELTTRGHRFATGSDLEVVAHLYEDSGLAALERLNGMFALAIADERTGEVHLVRDRVGVKPLYWTTAGGPLRFASELPALLLDETIPREVDLEGLAELLVLTHLPAPRTPLRAVHELEPGTVLTWRAGEVTVRPWWRWPDVSPDDVDPREVAATVRELVVDAVRLQLRADVPVGLLLSGGVDSTALLWAARELGSDVAAYCVDFEEPDADTGDTEYARLAAATYGARLRHRRLGGLDVEAWLPRLAATLSEPLGDPAVLPSAAICANAAEEVTVLLSGTGADELWGGYGRYTLEAADPVAAYVDNLSVLPEAEVRRALGLPAGRPVEERLRDTLAATGDTAAARMRLDGTLSMPAALLHLLDSTSMASSVEARVPLLDHRLVELAARLPGAVRVPGGDLKGLLRTALRGVVPDAVLDRPKRGFAPPLLDWASADLAGRADAALVSGDGLGALLDPAVSRRWVGADADDPGLVPLRSWLLAVTDQWWRTHRPDGRG